MQMNKSTLHARINVCCECLLPVGLGAPFNVQTNEHDADNNTSASLKERFFFSSFNASCACPSSVPVHIRQCVYTVCHYLLCCIFFGDFQKQTPTLAFLYGQRDGVCVYACVCVHTLPNMNKSKSLFQSLCSCSVMKSSFLFNSFIDERWTNFPGAGGIRWW